MKSHLSHSLEPQKAPLSHRRTLQDPAIMLKSLFPNKTQHGGALPSHPQLKPAAKVFSPAVAGTHPHPDGFKTPLAHGDTCSNSEPSLRNDLQDGERKDLARCSSSLGCREGHGPAFSVPLPRSGLAGGAHEAPREAQGREKTSFAVETCSSGTTTEGQGAPPAPELLPLAGCDLLLLLHPPMSPKSNINFQEVMDFSAGPVAIGQWVIVLN